MSTHAPHTPHKPPSRTRRVTVILAVAAYLASNVALGWVIAQEIQTSSRVTKIEHILRIEHVPAPSHRGRSVSPSKRTHGAGNRTHRPHGHSVTGGRTVAPRGTNAPHVGAGGTGQGHGQPNRPGSHPRGGGAHPTSSGHGGGGSGAPAPTLTVPSQHVGPVTTPSLTVTVPTLPPLP